MRDGGPEEDDVPALLPGLVYVNDTAPGITRRRRGKGFVYLDPARARISDPVEIGRISKLGIPPAYQDVWICPMPNGHLQATGIDAADRKQYRYHPDWSLWRSEAKFALLASFGLALARLRDRVTKDLECDPGELAFSLAALTLLIDRAHLRVGNTAHTQASRTYGATTLLNRHLTIEDAVVRLRFRAKGGKRVQQTLRGPRLHRIFQDIDDLPGRNLFTYVSEGGDVRKVDSHHVNDYLAEITGLPGVTAKTFRTWAGTLAAFETAQAAGDKLTIKMMSQVAAEELHNTPMIARKSYIHPAVLALAEEKPDDRRRRFDALAPAGPSRLRPSERSLLGYLQAVETPAV